MYPAVQTGQLRKWGPGSQTQKGDQLSHRLVKLMYSMCPLCIVGTLFFSRLNLGFFLFFYSSSILEPSWMLIYLWECAKGDVWHYHTLACTNRKWRAMSDYFPFDPFYVRMWEKNMFLNPVLGSGLMGSDQDTAVLILSWEHPMKYKEKETPKWRFKISLLIDF